MKATVSPLIMPVPEAAKNLGVSERTCQRYARDGRIPAVVFAGGRITIPRLAFMKWMRETTKVNGKPYFEDDVLDPLSEEDELADAAA